MQMHWKTNYKTNKQNGGVMLNKRVEEALNEQINAELWSAYLYLSMAAYFEDQNLSGFANWMRIQYQEETAHAMKFFDYINERGGRVMLKPIDKVDAEWKDIVHAFEDTLEHEQKVTSLIHNLVDIANEEKDHATFNFLQWFVEEQVEEEASADEILNKLKMLDGKGAGIFMMDKEMAGRTFVDPTKE